MYRQHLLQALAEQGRGRAFRTKGLAVTKTQRRPERGQRQKTSKMNRPGEDAKGDFA